MPATRSLHDCQTFCDSVANIGGTVPEPLRRLLSIGDMLMAPGATEDPIRPILDRAMDGDMDAKTVDKLLAAAATQTSIAEFRRELRARAEPVVVKRFHEALKDGCADAVLDSLRPAWDAAAEQIAHARSLINPESSAEHILSGGEPGVAEAWRGLYDHLAVVGTIGRIAQQFGPRTGSFPMITEYAGGEGFRLSDQAIWCTDGNLVMDSSLFHSPDRGHRTSPWFRCALRLHSVESARERYNAWAAAEFDRQHADRPRGGHIGDDGQVVYDKVPPNPYRESVNT